MKYLDMKTVLARFEGTSKDYSYFVPAGDKPEVGDYLVTSYTWDASHAPDPDWRERYVRNALLSARIARVIRLEPVVNAKATRFYLKLLPVSHIVAQVEANKALAEDVAKRAEAKRKLDAMLAERSQIDRYRELAKDDVEAAALLAVLEG